MTKQQEAIRQFIESELNEGKPCPSRREIADHFGFASHNAASCHIRALVKKGILVAAQGRARALRLAESIPGVPRAITAEIPLFGSIPAGFGDNRSQEPDGCVVVDVSSIGFKPTRNTFALRVVGDSMTGRFICDGDIVVLDHGPHPRNGEIIAALIDGKTTLKTFVQTGGTSYLKAENPKYPSLVPSEELVIQGVFKGLIRKASR